MTWSNSERTCVDCGLVSLSLSLIVIAHFGEKSAAPAAAWTEPWVSTVQYTQYTKQSSEFI